MDEQGTDREGGSTKHSKLRIAWQALTDQDSSRDEVARLNLWHLLVGFTVQFIAAAVLFARNGVAPVIFYVSACLVVVVVAAMIVRRRAD